MSATTTTTTTTTTSSRPRGIKITTEVTFYPDGTTFIRKQPKARGSIVMHPKTPGTLRYIRAMFDVRDNLG